jgi:hypothetical protein
MTQQKTVKDYIKIVMKRDNISFTQARRKAIEEIRSGKAIGSVKIQALGHALDSIDKLDDILATMGEDDDD